MKKSLLILILAGLLCFTACAKKDTEKTEEKVKETTSTEIVESTTLEKVSETETTESATEIVKEKEVKLPLPFEAFQLDLSSGAGGWVSVLYLNSDGTFTGYYADSEMGSVGEDHPKGTYYTNEFSGKFVNIKKINDYSYSMELSSIELVKEPGEEWIENEVLYIAGEPLGIEAGKKFIFYTGDAPINEMDEELLNWWPYRYNESLNTNTTLYFYGVYNVEKGYGFFGI